MNILSDAAIGGLTGGATAGPVGAIIGAGGSVLSSLLGGIFGSSSQEEANRTNLQIARERNEMQERLFNQQIANDWKMFDATNTWNSAAEQRKRMEEAGFNPNMIFGSGLGSAQNISSPSAPNLATAQVQPVDAFARSIGNSVGDAAQVMALLSQSRKADAEATAQTIDNITKGAQNEVNLVGSGAGALTNLLDLYIKQQAKEDMIKAVGIGNEVQEATRDKIRADEAVSKAQAALVSSQIDLNKEQQNYLVEQIKLAVEQGKTEITKQELNRTQAFKNESEARLNEILGICNKIIATSTAEKNQAEAGYYREGAKVQTNLAEKVKQEGEFTSEQKKILQNYGLKQADATYLKTLVETGQLQKASDYLIEQARKTGKEANWTDIKSLMDVLTDFSKFVNSFTK